MTVHHRLGLIFEGKYRHLAVLAVVIVAIATSTVSGQQDSSVLATLKAEALSLRPLVKSEVASTFLESVRDLPSITSPRIAYVRKEPRAYLSTADFNLLGDSARFGFERRELGEEFYYYTRYGTPLAFVRPLDLIGQAGFKSLDHARVIDFGYGSIGQLRLMASHGATVFGIEVDPLLKILYGDSGDTGPIPRSKAAGPGSGGSVTSLIGSFPSDSNLTAALGGTFDVFFSKNTLKRGYIHPEREVDPRMLVNLGVDDSTFITRVYNLLKPGGYFMIYNLHPARSAPDQPYIPWSDGRCPFEQQMLETIGFKLLAFDRDDTEFAHTMAKALGWDKEMNLSKDLFGTYTLLQK
jgi:hypothetical protein